jgi:hypothetical protein
MTNTRAIRRVIGSAAVATATAGITIAANTMAAAPATSATTYPLCEKVTVSGAVNKTLGGCFNSPLPTNCTTVTPAAFGQTAAVEVCIID